jgi:tRNA modification GTPase
MQMPGLDDTIIAVSTGWQPAPLGILRLSGSDARELVAQIGVQLPTPDEQPQAGWCEASLVLSDQLRLPATVYWFRAPRSYTRQDVVEIHTIGSLPALRAVSARLIGLGARRALPGEFTARAYLNGRLDVGQVEGVLALISAHDRTAARRAVRLSRRSHQPRLEALGGRLTTLIADVEAGIDFVDEEDIHFITPDELKRTIDELIAEVAALGRPDRGLDHASRPHIALAGLPNAGKSTLFNALLGYERAIVSPVLGTTRDVLSAEVTLGDVAAVLQDCAGLGRNADELEVAAHLAAEHAANHADVILWLHEADADWDADEIQACQCVPSDRRVLAVSKCDRCPARDKRSAPVPFSASVAISGVTGAGLDNLRQILAQRLEAVGASASAGIAAQQLDPALSALRSAREAGVVVGETIAVPELVALELRRACEALELAGRGRLADEVLASILSRFCIGK